MTTETTTSNDGDGDAGNSDIAPYPGDATPRLYSSLAPWFHLLTAPEEYREEAAFYRDALVGACAQPPTTVLELGSGGGNNAMHLKRDFTMTLTDLSDDMLALSRTINPDLEHIQGDMRTLRLDRTFDAVFMHDAVCYLLSEGDIERALRTAYVHCAPGGAVLVVPDDFVESFVECSDKGGHNQKGSLRGLRYLQWCWDPDPSDCTYETVFTVVMREADGSIHTEVDHHRFGLFSRDTWMRLLRAVGFSPRMVTAHFLDTAFVGVKPA